MTKAMHSYVCNLCDHQHTIEEYDFSESDVSKLSFHRLQQYAESDLTDLEIEDREEALKVIGHSDALKAVLTDKKSKISKEIDLAIRDADMMRDQAIDFLKISIGRTEKG